MTVSRYERHSAQIGNPPPPQEAIAAKIAGSAAWEKFSPGSSGGCRNSVIHLFSVNSHNKFSNRLNSGLTEETGVNFAKETPCRKSLAVAQSQSAKRPAWQRDLLRRCC